MTYILLCPGCKADLTATTDKDNRPLWRCGECGFSDTPLEREMALWRVAYNRGGWQR